VRPHGPGAPAVQELAARAGVPTPRLYPIPSEQPNAFATGWNPQHRGRRRDRRAAPAPRQDQVKGVLAHEFGHIRNRDIFFSSIAAVLAGAIAAIANLQFSLLFGGEDDDSGLGLLGTVATVVAAGATLLQLAVSRQREYLADATGAQLLGRAGQLADALESLEQGAQALPMNVDPAPASFCAVDPLPRRGVAPLFMTQPPIEERIRRLRALDGIRALELVA
jgi:heat shock protein HtpX